MLSYNWFSASLTFPPLFCFFSFFFLFLSFHCYHSVTGAWMSLCAGAHGWVAGTASHGSVLLSRGWLITVEAPGHPGHPPSTQLDAVANVLLLTARWKQQLIIITMRSSLNNSVPASRLCSPKKTCYDNINCLQMINCRRSTQ